MKQKNIDSYIKELGIQIRKEREEQGYSQEEFAHAFGFGYSYYSRVERGQINLTLRNLLRITEALGVLPSKLLSKIEL